MSYIFPSGALDKFDTLRTDYERKTGVNLKKKPSKVGMPTFFGGTDVLTRKAQILLIQQIKHGLQANLHEVAAIEHPKQAQANLTATRSLIAVCLYVQSQINAPQSNSSLFNLINKALGINSKNPLTAQEQELCFHAANRLFSHSAALDEINELLRSTTKLKLKAISEATWNDLRQYIGQQCTTSSTPNPYANYPVTSVTKPLFGFVFASAGAAAGVVAGDIFANSMNGYHLTATMGGTLVVFGPAGVAGLPLFAPVIAAKFVNAFFKITLATCMGFAMGHVGKAFGIAVGVPLDLAVKGLGKAGSAAKRYVRGSKKSAPMDGLQIVDGKFMIGGITCELIKPDTITQGVETKYVIIDKEGYVIVDGQRVTDPKSGELLPPLDVRALEKELTPGDAVDEDSEEEDAAAALAL